MIAFPAGGLNSTMPRPKKPIDPRVILADLEDLLGRWGENGGTLSVVNTDASGRAAVGFVLDDAYMCTRCMGLFVRNKTQDTLECAACTSARARAAMENEKKNM